MATVPTGLLPVVSISYMICTQVSSVSIKLGQEVASVVGAVVFVSTEVAVPASVETTISSAALVGLDSAPQLSAIRKSEVLKSTHKLSSYHLTNTVNCTNLPTATSNTSPITWPIPHEPGGTFVYGYAPCTQGWVSVGDHSIGKGREGVTHNWIVNLYHA